MTSHHDDADDAGADSGKVLSEHPATVDGIVTRYQFTLFCFAALCIPGGVFVGIGINRGEPYLTAAGAAVAACGVGCLFYVLLNMRRGVRRVVLTGKGIRWDDEGTVHDKGWQDVREVYTSDVLTRGDRKTDLRVVFDDGSGMRVDNRLRKYDALRKSILALSSWALLDRKRRELAAGKADFGPLSLHPDGVEFRDAKKTWDELEQ